MSVEERIRSALRDRARGVQPASGWDEIERRLDEGIGTPPNVPATMSIPRRMAIAALAFVVFAAGGLLAWRAFGFDVAPSVGSGDPRCHSDDQPGLITCEQALQRAHEYSSVGDIAQADARLDDYREHPGNEAVLAWVVTYHDVQVPTHGPPPGPSRCVLGDWDVVLDAHTGSYLVEGTGGIQRPCPSLSKTSVPPYVAPSVGADGQCPRPGGDSNELTVVSVLNGPEGTVVDVSGPVPHLNEAGMYNDMPADYQIWWNVDSEGWTAVAGQAADLAAGQQPAFDIPPGVRMLGDQHVTKECSFQVTFVVPDVPAGTYPVTVIDASGGGATNRASFTFTVTP